jgi:hypothetical protein
VGGSTCGGSTCGGTTGSGGSTAGTGDTGSGSTGSGTTVASSGGGGGGGVSIGGFSGLYDSASAGDLADALGPHCVQVLKDPQRYSHRLWERCHWLADRYLKRRHQASK